MRHILAVLIAVVMMSTCATGKVSGKAQVVAVNKPKTNPLVPPPVTPPEMPAPKVGCQAPCVEVAAVVGVITSEMAETFKAYLDTLKEKHVSAIVLGIASPGGDFEASEEIFNAIKDSEIPVYCYVKKAAMSGAFWLLQACKERVGESDARLMTHSPYVMTREGAKLDRQLMTKLISELDMMESVMCGSIAGRMKMTPDALAKRLQAGDWFMSASQAVTANALDRVVPPGQQSFDSYIESIRARARH